jgi:hypothetical protein
MSGHGLLNLNQNGKQIFENIELTSLAQDEDLYNSKDSDEEF